MEEDMTLAQADLLRRCIEADRNYHSRKKNGEWVSMDERGVEIGWINGTNSRTAQVLADHGLIELVNIMGVRHTYAFLGSYLV
jgi:hypothetical protein